MVKKRQGHLVILQDNIESIVEGAGDEKEQPLPPPQGIPRQWLPRPIARAIQRVCLPFVLLDIAALRVAKWLIRPPFKRVGRCKRRGNCCHYIVMRHKRGLLGKLQHFWATQVNGFYPRNPEPLDYDGKPVYLMGCRYLRKDGSCGNYRLRPLVCRQWPVIEHFGWPGILKGCGYEARLKKKAR